MRTIILILAVITLSAFGPGTSAFAANHEGCDGHNSAASAEKAGIVKDPVCGMDVNTADAKHVYEYKGEKYYFCSKDDMEKFKGDPGKYIKKGLQ